MHHIPLPTPRHARLSLFGEDENSGMLQEIWDLCQSNDARAWEMAAAKAREVMFVCARCASGINENPTISRADIDTALGRLA